MFTLFFTVLFAAGAWTSWRRNPMYSRGRTVRFVLTIGFTIAAVIGIMVAAIRLTTNQSEAVSDTAMFGSIALGALTLIWVIVKVCTPPDIALPASATLLRIHRARIDAWSKRAAIVFLALTTAALIAPGSERDVILPIGGLALFVTLTSLFAAYLSARVLDRSLTALQADPWLHWQYPPDQWELWVAARVETERLTPPTFLWRKQWPLIALPLTLIAGTVLYFAEGSFRFRVTAVLTIAGALIASLFLVQWFQARRPTALRNRLRKAPREVYIGQNGLFAEGVFIPWLSTGIYLCLAEREAGPPPALIFLFERVSRGAGSTEIRQPVLIPAHAEPDLANLQTRLTAKFPDTSIQLRHPG